MSMIFAVVGIAESGSEMVRSIKDLTGGKMSMARRTAGRATGISLTTGAADAEAGEDAGGAPFVSPEESHTGHSFAVGGISPPHSGQIQ